MGDRGVAMGDRGAGKRVTGLIPASQPPPPEYVMERRRRPLPSSDFIFAPLVIYTFLDHGALVSSTLLLTFPLDIPAPRFRAGGRRTRNPAL